ncbi:MAG: methylenetetrahydrofolate--tRNA-(uracil(54)-C(5))-methyltransferase (FADH(2)-oxidizing) TrmFO [bacterium]|nr:MAG: methylenetetrahydrofolate--tRNA-(uracil(54)-C(5))-methyltransferase (FADH(2)-oxidizing) TrmFO [bacterium]
MRPIEVIGGGLAGCEAAWQIAKRGIPVLISEMKPHRRSPAHRSGDLAELVCSNSLKSDRIDRAGGLLKAELRLMGSLLLDIASRTAIPGGSSLCVDRNRFSQSVTAAIEDQPLISLVRKEILTLPDGGPTVVATGPLTSDSLAGSIENLMGRGSLAFYDAIAPTVEAESIDWEKVFLQDRYGDAGSGAYVNCPLEREEYFVFLEALRKAEQVMPRPFEEERVFEACLPVEVLAARGDRTLAFGPMRPVGLTDPRTSRRPFAVVQLRPENESGTLYSMVGFQTKLKYAEQERVFRMIPGLERARFERLGSVHRNTFIDAPRLLDRFQRARKAPRLIFAGQITGVEGYVESIASGALAGIYASAAYRDIPVEPPPPTTMVGALLHHLTHQASKPFQPVNAQFGLLQTMDGQGGRRSDRRTLLSERALADMREYIASLPSGL